MREMILAHIPPVALGFIFGGLTESSLWTLVGIVIGMPIGVAYLYWEYHR